MSGQSPFAGNLRDLRSHFGYTLEQTAEGVGVTRQSIAKWESGQAVPDIFHAADLAKFYDVALDELINHDTAASGIGIPPKGKHLFGTVQIGERGQVVIPKVARDLFQLKKGDRLVALGDETGPLPGLAFVKSDVFLDQAAAYGHMLQQGKADSHDQ
ncbi:MAG: helix-turn-helix domain-containing protein [Lentilactobacillus hilgardii]|uniref:helix-turn-helix domain-containing protein n=1 Tax=Lentilactobacillus hilgardii TaxID=1588 RepID=UPI001CC216CB|nr:helix-turn-helix domain-containing protein [Lentilactobacillus hilgardii]MBZ2201808.1 XRE family transcriptional regulator [Lentilactobacillus hilgardii]MBZ2204725.1 XRE family transcriptional regulator [Lentilactobacillus hilgardii]